MARRCRRRSAAPKKRLSERRFEENLTILEPLMDAVALLGRLPERDELPAFHALTAEFGSINRAFALVRRVTGDDAWTSITARKTKDLLVYLALGRFQRRPLNHDGVQSRTPINSYLEMTWSLLGTWVLKLMTVRELVKENVAPKKMSVASARNLVRRAMRNSPPRDRGRSFAQALAACQTDNYHRTQPKASRNYPRKKRHKPPQPPKIKSATEQQRQLAQPLTPLTIAN
jgi:hypothetical protein